MGASLGAPSGRHRLRYLAQRGMNFYSESDQQRFPSLRGQRPCPEARLRHPAYLPSRCDCEGLGNHDRDWPYQFLRIRVVSLKRDP
jgi:hypothetical protein